jgi:hypothetical protein
MAPGGLKIANIKQKAAVRSAAFFVLEDLTLFRKFWCVDGCNSTLAKRPRFWKVALATESPMPFEKIRKGQLIKVYDQSARLHITHDNHMQVWEDLTLLRERPNTIVDYHRKPQILRFRMGDNQLTKESADIAVAAFDEDTLDTIIRELATIVHGRRVRAKWDEYQMKFGDNDREDYCFDLSFDHDLYSYEVHHMGQAEEFTPYAQPWDKIVK